MTERLTKAEWIAHGLATLERAGPGGLVVGPMAVALNVSRGSFYWHFRDIADFRAELLQAWRERTTDTVIRSVDGEAAPERLKALIRRAFTAAPGVDRAIRAWAIDDPEAAAAVAAVDIRRIAYISGLLTGAGVAQEKAAARATFLYWAHLGQPLSLDGGALSAAALDDVCALVEA